MKTKEQIQKYNKEYFARPEVIARAKIRNANYRKRRQEYKKTEKGKLAEKKYRSNPKVDEDKKWNRIKNRYGLTKEQFENMLIEQNNNCKICGREIKTKLHIDHCHKTGKVRGLLCSNCNMALGLMKDSIEVLNNAVLYLKCTH